MLLLTIYTRTRRTRIVSITVLQQQLPQLSQPTQQQSCLNGLSTMIQMSGSSMYLIRAF